MNADKKEMFRKVSAEMENYLAADSIRALSDYLGRYYGKKPIILLDEYDTPMQEAYVGGYWNDMVEFIRKLFNATFKTNPYFDRAIMTGITRISKESIFSVMLEPKCQEDDAIIMEFKVYNSKKEKDLEETIASALAQIDDKHYTAALEAKGIAPERIRKYGFAFEGKNVLIG